MTGAGGQDATSRLGPEVNIHALRILHTPNRKLELTQQELRGNRSLENGYFWAGVCSYLANELERHIHPEKRRPPSQHAWVLLP